MVNCADPDLEQWPPALSLGSGEGGGGDHQDLQNRNFSEFDIIFAIAIWYETED
jgi:hypothetical protein